jgi:hypothetical protein
VEIELKLGGVEIEIKGLRGLATLLGLAAVGAVVAREMGMSREQRTWHGRLVGVVPYDLRPPTLARLRASIWDPTTAAVLGPTAFGVGWAPNLAALVERCGWSAPAARPPADAEPALAR